MTDLERKSTKSSTFSKVGTADQLMSNSNSRNILAFIENEKNYNFFSSHNFFVYKNLERFRDLRRKNKSGNSNLIKISNFGGLVFRGGDPVGGKILASVSLSPKQSAKKFAAMYIKHEKNLATSTVHNTKQYS